MAVSRVDTSAVEKRVLHKLTPEESAWLINKHVERPDLTATDIARLAARVFGYGFNAQAVRGLIKRSETRKEVNDGTTNDA